MTSAIPPPQSVLIFGASGDLARRKILPALYNLAGCGLLPERYAIVGFAMEEWDDDEFRGRARAAVKEFSRTPVDDEVWKPFAGSLTYVPGTFEGKDCLRTLDEHLAQRNGDGPVGGRRLYYCATPASAFFDLIGGLGECGSQDGNRIVLEKPFGHDLASAQELNRLAHEVFDESQIFRIDHFLGKETVQNLLTLRFANTMVERMWHRDAIDHVQISAAESVGLEGRGGFYEETGAVRDMLQNHLLQLLAFVAMEPPRSLEPDAIRDETVKVLRALRPFEGNDVVRGQYAAGAVGGVDVPGYRDEPDVADDSTVETFVALRTTIDNWRWASVPFYLQTGKRLPHKGTEVTVRFKDVPGHLFRPDLDVPPANILSIRIQPEAGISFGFQAKPPGLRFAPRTVAMNFSYREWFKGQPEAYERLLYDAMIGDATLFIRQDAIERAWELVTPLLEAPPALERYRAGSWSDEARRLIAPRSWHVEAGHVAPRLEELMTTDVRTLGPEASLADATKIMVQGRFGAVPVVGDHRLAGILTERDVLRATSAGADPATARVSEWMTPDPVTGSPEMDAEDAAEIMTSQDFRHLPVTSGDAIAGMVSLRDVMSARINPSGSDQDQKPSQP